MKVYCKNCNYNLYNLVVCYRFSEITYMNKLNKSHNCKYYQRKWWKFWIKDDSQS